MNRISRLEKQEPTKVDRITKKLLTSMRLEDKLLVYNAPLNMSVTIEKAYEIRNYGSKQVAYDLKKFIVSDDCTKKPFSSIEFTDLDVIKKYVTSLYEARLEREVKFLKLLIEKNICVGDVVKKSTSAGVHLLVVQKFQDTDADKIVVKGLKLDKNHRITDKVIGSDITKIRRMKSIKIKK